MLRHEFSAKTKVAAFERSRGNCEGCGAKLFAGNIEYDHQIPCGLGGDNSLENCIVRCRACHSTKTHKTDVPQIAKAKRRQRNHIGVKKQSSRPMLGTKASGVRKRMNGTVERW
jgi:5-methylcytosine-specific restriction protein A